MPRTGTNRKGEYPVVGYRLPPEVAAELKRLAKEEGVPVSAFVHFALEQFAVWYRDRAKRSGRVKSLDELKRRIMYSSVNSRRAPKRR